LLVDIASGTVPAAAMMVNFVGYSSKDTISCLKLAPGKRAAYSFSTQPQ
jgi:hypothetical protein